MNSNYEYFVKSLELEFTPDEVKIILYKLKKYFPEMFNKVVVVDKVKVPINELMKNHFC